VATFANALALRLMVAGRKAHGPASCELGEAFQAINGHAMAMAISAAGEWCPATASSIARTADATAAC